ncbi:MAG TPA: AAA family ATPase, partial [Acidimicrobiales bacterium]|nr:AAA family ATPase [Acidimicrobiales bacterium]
MVADPFVGRDAESAALDEGLSRAWLGEGRLFLVSGEPGIGKSRLASELTTRARAAGAQVGWGRCWEAGGAPAYWPWAEVLTSLVDHLGVDALRASLGASADDLGQIVPVLADERPDTRLAPDTARFRLYDAVVRLCRLSTADAPMVAVIDDVHVADPSSLLLLQFLAGQVGSMGLVVVATYRDADAVAMSDGFTEVLAQLVRERTTTRLRLAGLDEAGVALVIGAATGTGPSARLVTRVRELTDGNPLYVGEAARLLVMEGRFDTSVDSDRLPIPRDVRETVLRRLAQLSPACQRVLELAAVLGRDFPLDVLRELAGPALDIVAALDEAASASVIVDSPGRVGHLRFGHAVMSEALYQEIPSLRRRRLHDEAGRALEALRGGDLGPRLTELARHSCASLPVGPVDRAVDYARLAGERAVQQLAYEEGARLYEMALQALSGAPDDATRIELLLALGDAQSRAGDTDVAKATFLEAADLARQLHDVEAFARSAIGYSGRFVWMRAGSDTKIIPLLHEALAALPAGDSALRVRLLARLAGARRDDWDMRPRDELSLEAVETAARIGDPATSAYALISRAMSIWGPRGAFEMRTLAEQAIALAAEAGDQEHVAAARLNRAQSIFATGPPDMVRPAFEDYAATAVELRQPSHLWYAGLMRTSVLLLEGRLEEAEANAERTYTEGQKAQSWDAGAAHLLALAALRREQGRLGELEDDLVEAGVLYPGYRLFRCVLALACLETGRRDEAVALTTEIVRGGEETLPHDNGWAYGMATLSDVVARTLDRDLAQTMYEAMVPFAHLMATGGGEIAGGALERSLGQLASVLDRTDDALVHFERARALHRAYRSDIWVAHTDVEEAAA